MGHEQNTVRSIFPVALTMLLGETLSCAVSLIFAGYYGAGAQSDAYVAANGMISFPVLLLASGISATFIPYYTKRSKEQADRFANNILSIYALISAGIGLLLMLTCGFFIRVLNPGFDQTRISLAVPAARIMLCTLPFVITAMLLSQILEANERFAASRICSFPRSIFLAISCVFFSQKYGIMSAAVAIVLSELFQAALTWQLCKKNFAYAPMLNMKAGYLREMFFHTLPAASTVAVNQLGMFLRRGIASHMEVGAMTAMAFSMQLVMFLLSVFTFPITTIMFPRLSRLAAEKNHEAFTDCLTVSMKRVLLFMLPAVIVLCVAHEPVIRLIYGRGMFDENSIRLTSVIFLFQLPGALGMGLRMLFTSAFHACTDTSTPLKVSIYMALCNVCLCVILSKRMGIVGLSLSSTIVSLMGAMILYVLLSKKLQLQTSVVFHPVAKILLSGVICLLGTVLISGAVPYSCTISGSIRYLLTCSFPCVGLYCLILGLLDDRIIE